MRVQLFRSTVKHALAQDECCWLRRRVNETYVFCNMPCHDNEKRKGRMKEHTPTVHLHYCLVFPPICLSSPSYRGPHAKSVLSLISSALVRWPMMGTPAGT